MKNAKNILCKIALVLTIVFALLCIAQDVMSLIQQGPSVIHDPEISVFYKVSFFALRLLETITCIGLTTGSVHLLARRVSFTKTVLAITVLHLINFSVPLFGDIVSYSTTISVSVGFVASLLIGIFQYLFVCVSIAVLIIALCQITKKEKAAKQNISTTPVD